jgi:hypothetical protein
MDAMGLFFIPSKDGEGLVPIMVAITPATDSSSPPNFHVGYNPQYSETKLKERSLTIMDVIIPFSDLKEPLLNENVKKLSEMFDNPPAAKESDSFKNLLFERLYAITQNDEYKFSPQASN